MGDRSHVATVTLLKINRKTDRSRQKTSEQNREKKWMRLARPTWDESYEQEKVEME